MNVRLLLGPVIAVAQTPFDRQRRHYCQTVSHSGLQAGR